MSASLNHARSRRNWRRRIETSTSDGRRLAVAGSAMLLIALVLVLFTFSGWLLPVVAAAATAVLAFDRRLGPIPAAMLVMLALPVGRGSEVGLAEIAGYPVRPHDTVAAVGVILALPAIGGSLRCGSRVLTAATVPFLTFLAVGVLALVLGVAGDQAFRDIVRDMRWWAFYAIGLLALLAGVRRDQVTRALTWGMTLYATVVLVGLLMPNFDQGLKFGAYLYDERLRMHYGQAIFLIPAATFASANALRRPLPWLAVLGLLAAAIGVTLTRALFVAFVAAVLLTIAWGAFTWIRRHRVRGRSWKSRRPVGHWALAAVVTAAGLAGGVAAYSAGTQIWMPASTDSDGGADPDAAGGSDGRPPVNVADRIVGRQGTDFEAQAGGRLASYARAFTQTAEAPVLGHGAGELTYIDWTRGEFAGHTRNAQPGVDNAYLTVGLKAGAVGVASLGVLLLWPLRRFLAIRRAGFWAWYLPAWLAMLALTMIQSFAVSGYAPIAVALLVALPFLTARSGTRR